jgi:septal ring factor EnvC (AmiA/AmiB activator)
MALEACRRMNCCILLSAVALLALNCFAAEEASPLARTRTTLEQWVETRQLISRTGSDWQTDKETLEQTIQLYERELKSIEEQMAKVSTNSTQVDKERAQAEAQLKSSNESLDRTRQFAADFEGKVTRFVPQLPAPLQEALKPLLARLPADSTNTKMAATERVQVLVGILNELDKFNNAVNLFSEKRKNEKGEEIAVETVYVGLGAAYFVNDADNFAGTGTPGPNGWEWAIKPELAASIRQVVRIYRNELAAKFIALPATIR